MQAEAFTQIMSAVDFTEAREKCFFIDAPGGTGMSYLFEAIAHLLRSRNETPIVVANTGIAATLLQGGKTAHSVFKIPIPAVENSTSSIKLYSMEAKLIEKSKIILWDECTMATVYILAVVNRLLRFVKKNDIPFGGTTFVSARDFRRTLPVVKRGDAAKIIESTLKRSSLWKYFQVLGLGHNMRLEVDQTDFGATEGNPALGSDYIEIPESCVVQESIVDEIFGLSIDPNNISDLTKKFVLCPTNVNTLDINNKVITKLGGSPKIYYSADVEEDETNAYLYPTEFLNSLTRSSIPPFKLELKKVATVILLQNLATKDGLCNGVRLIVQKLLNTVTVATILTGSAIGKTV